MKTTTKICTICGNELKFLTKQLAIIREDLQFIFKLHPNEFHYFDIISRCAAELMRQRQFFRIDYREY